MCPPCASEGLIKHCICIFTGVSLPFYCVQLQWESLQGPLRSHTVLKRCRSVLQLRPAQHSFSQPTLEAPSADESHGPRCQMRDRAGIFSLQNFTVWVLVSGKSTQWWSRQNSHLILILEFNNSFACVSRCLLLKQCRTFVCINKCVYPELPKVRKMILISSE